MNSIRRQLARVCLPLLPLLAVASASAQLPLERYDGDAVRDWFGHSVRPAGDVDDDGVLDYIVGASQNLYPGHSPFPGYARVYSGADNSVLHTFVGDGTAWTDGPDDHLGASVDGAGDVDGDGHDDLIVGAYKDDNGLQQNAGMVRVYSGDTGDVLYQLDGETPGDRMGISVRRLGDVSGDGVPDQLIGIYKDDALAINAGAVRVISGVDGATLYEVASSGTADALGWVVAPLGDVDGDGWPDFVTGALQWGQGAGYARVFSGFDGDELYTVAGDSFGDLLGWSVAGVGDVTGDGVPDFAAGAPQADVSGVVTGPGYVRIYSGADGTPAATWTGEELGDGFGLAIDAAGDVNGDGQADVVVGAPRWRDPGDLGKPGYVRVHSGDDGTILQLLRGAEAGDLFGWAVAGDFDHDGDGLSDVLVGCPEDVVGAEGEGYAVLHAAMCNPPPVVYCVGAPNSVGPGARISIEGSLSVEVANLVLVGTGMPSNHFGLFYYGPNPVQLPFGDGFRCVGGVLVRLPVVGSDRGGRIETAVDLGDPVWAPGQSHNVQLWYRDPFAFQTGFNLSDALAITLCP